MNSNFPRQLVVRGEGVLSRPLEDFAEDLQDRFAKELCVIEYNESSDGWTWFLRCALNRGDCDTLAEIKDYLQVYFASDVGGELELDNTVTPLFEVVPGVFFVRNTTDSEGSKVEVQLVDRFGRARESREFRVTEKRLVIGDTRVPQSVVDAGLRQSVGAGDFVDINGEQIIPSEIDKHRQL